MPSLVWYAIAYPSPNFKGFIVAVLEWINDWVNNREAGDLRYYRAHYDVNVMDILFYCSIQNTEENQFSKSAQNWVIYVWPFSPENLTRHRGIEQVMQGFDSSFLL